MKISKVQKEQNRKALLYAGIEIMQKEGIKNATMKNIASRAGMSEAVIYRYYPSKDHLLFEFFDECFSNAIAKTESIPGFSEFSFVEQIQCLIDAHLEEFKKHKPFVLTAFKTLFLTTLTSSMVYFQEQRRSYNIFVGELMDAAVAIDEFPNPPIKNIVIDLLWNFHIGTIYFWLNDESKNTEKTTQMMDKSLGLFNEVLKSNILTRLLDVGYFLAREHFLKGFDKHVTLSENQKENKKKILKKENDPKNKTRKK